MFDRADARSALAPSAAPPPEAYGDASHVEFDAVAPALEARGARSWYARGQHFVVEFSRVDGEHVVESAEPHESVLVLPGDGVVATVRTGGGAVEVGGRRLAFVPPGDGAIELRGSGVAIRLVTSDSALAPLAANAGTYATPHPNLAPLEPWPAPADGFRVRVYDLTVPAMENPRFRLFRGTTFMVNFIDPHDGPRDPERLSPHSHDDFEQCSLVLEGEYVHHLRWPWTTRKSMWRDDRHDRVTGPAVTVIPARVEHTSEAVGAGANHLVDIFCPPRADFSAQPGWVLNAVDYPQP